MKKIAILMISVLSIGCFGPRWAPITDFRCIAQLGDFDPAIQGAELPASGGTLLLDVKEVDRPYFLQLSCQRDDALDLHNLGPTAPSLPCSIRVTVSNPKALVLENTVTNFTNSGSFSAPNHLSYFLTQIKFPRKGKYYLTIRNNMPLPTFQSASNCVAELEWVGSERNDPRNLIVKH